MIPKNLYGLMTAERPNWGMFQVLDLADVVVGMTYYYMTQQGLVSELVKVTEITSEKITFVEVHGEQRIVETFLCDAGLVPYINHFEQPMWNTANSFRFNMRNYE